MNKLFGPKAQITTTSPTAEKNLTQQTPTTAKKPLSFNNLFGHLLKTEEKKSETTTSENTNSVNSDRGLFQTNNQEKTENTQESEKPFRFVREIPIKYIQQHNEQLATRAQNMGGRIDHKFTELNTALSNGNIELIEKGAEELNELEQEVTALLNDLSEAATQDPSLKKTVRQLSEKLDMVQAKSQEAKFMVADILAPKIVEKPANKIVDIVAKSIAIEKLANPVEDVSIESVLAKLEEQRPAEKSQIKEKVTVVKYNLPDNLKELYDMSSNLLSDMIENESVVANLQGTIKQLKEKYVKAQMEYDDLEKGSNKKLGKLLDSYKIRLKALLLKKKEVQAMIDKQTSKQAAINAKIGDQLRTQPKQTDAEKRIEMGLRKMHVDANPDLDKETNKMMRELQKEVRQEKRNREVMTN